ncbi:MAG TPA: DNA adenine methylase, partial [Acidimicrobiales bacterium]|nr:DNA adenine methylase [Acidimicrobiales bacterium]
RVAQAFKRRGIDVTAVDAARYAHAFARCYVETDAAAITPHTLGDALARLNRLPGADGYVTETFCQRSRFFQPFNGRRIDAVRQAIANDYAGTPLEAILLTSLIEAADRVDSTIGVQMAYVKDWAQRSYRPLELRCPELLGGTGRAVQGDAPTLARSLGRFDLAYLDPPYNQHRYFTNYHVWETLVAWDSPVHYGVACKRLDAKDPSTRSDFNSKRTMPAALAGTVAAIDCGLLLLSYNDESWVSVEELERMCSHHREVVTLSFESARYVGARIGIHDPSGVKVGTVSHLYNREFLVIAGAVTAVRRAVTAAMGAHPGTRPPAPREEPSPVRRP